MSLFSKLFGGKREPVVIRVEPPVGEVPAPRRPRSRARSMTAPAGSAFSNLLGSAGYDATNADRFGDQWQTQPLTADQIIERNQATLVGRSMDQVRNNDYAKAFIRMVANNVVGHAGIVMQPKVKKADGKLDTEVNKALALAWADWSQAEHCDVTGKKSFRLHQKSAARNTASMGEYLYRLVFGPQYGGKYGFALQWINPQRLPVMMKIDNMPDGHFVRFGIEFNRYGRPVAYYFATQDATSEYLNFGGTDYERIPANEIIHGFEDELGGQKRGLPWLATSLFRSRQLAGMESSALINARAGANKHGYIEQEKDTDNPLLEWDAEEDGDFEVSSEPGEVNILPPGAKYKEVNPQYPAGEYSGFKKSHLQGIASGFGVSYNNLANDLEGVNFSSIRQGALDERENWKEIQEWFIESFVEKVYRAWLPRALLGGLIKVNGRPISATRLLDLQQVEWQARRWDWIDPEKDVNANVTAINKGLTTAGRVIREKGLDPQAVWQERADEVQEQINLHIAAGMSKENAERLVLVNSGYDPKILAAESATNETTNPKPDNRA